MICSYEIVIAITENLLDSNINGVEIFSSLIDSSIFLDFLHDEKNNLVQLKGLYLNHVKKGKSKDSHSFKELKKYYSDNSFIVVVKDGSLAKGTSLDNGRRKYYLNFYNK